MGIRSPVFRLLAGLVLIVLVLLLLTVCGYGVGCFMDRFGIFWAFADENPVDRAIIGSWVLSGVALIGVLVGLGIWCTVKLLFEKRYY